MNADAPVTALLRAYADAVHAKDVDLLLALYDEDVVVFDTWQWAYTGVAAWRATVAEWFGALGDERVVVGWDDVHSTSGEGIVAIHAVVTYAGMAANGVELRSMQNRLTWVARAWDGGLRIAHEHTSAPAAFDTMKVSLQR